MAKDNRAHPIDEPVLLREGVMHREDDFHGNAKYYTLPPDHPERVKKGDIGFRDTENWAPPKSSFESPGIVFKNLK